MIKYTVEKPKKQFPYFGDLKIGEYFYPSSYLENVNSKPPIWRKISKYDAISMRNDILPWSDDTNVVLVEPEGEIVFKIKKSEWNTND